MKQLQFSACDCQVAASTVRSALRSLSTAACFGMRLTTRPELTADGFSGAGGRLPAGDCPPLSLSRRIRSSWLPFVASSKICATHCLICRFASRAACLMRFISSALTSQCRYGMYLAYASNARNASCYTGNIL